MRLKLCFIFWILLNLIHFELLCQSDTTKVISEEMTLYSSACKLIDSTRYKEAISVLKKAIKLKPDYTDAFNKMAFAKLKLMDYKGAEKDLNTAFRISPDNFDTKKSLGILYYETKRFPESKAMIDSAILINLFDWELFYYQAKLMFEGKAYKLAFDACTKSIDLNPKSFEVAYLKCEIRYAMKEYAYCIKEISEAISTMPATNPPYKAYKLRAKARFEVKDYKNALKDWNVYLEAFPDEEEALVLRGASKIETGDYTGAIVDFDAAIRINPDNPVSYNYRGVAKGENRQFVEALKDFDYSIKLKYNYAGAFVNRAAVKFASKDKRGACDDLNRADSLGDDMAIQLIETYCKY